MSMLVVQTLKPIDMSDLDQLKSEIEELINQLTGNMMEDMEIRDKINNLEMKVKGIKTMDTRIDCIGCGL